MDRRIILWIVVLAAAFFILLKITAPSDRVCFQSNKCVKVEVADTPENRSKGLMNRTRLSGDEGMLFAFDEDDIYSFWMKNTLIPLDLIWINSSLKVVSIEHAMPCTQDPCRTYSPNEIARFVLEVNINYTMENNINKGDNAEFYVTSRPCLLTAQTCSRRDSQ